MDPDQTWRDLIDAINHGDVQAAGERAEDLTDWIRHDGFHPQGLIDATAALA